MLRKVMAFLCVLGTGLTHATELTQNNAPKDNSSEMTAEVRSFMSNIDASKSLPVSGLALVQSGSRLFLVTSNGHFVITGDFKLVDLWQSKIIKSIEDTKGIHKIDLHRIGIKPEEIEVFKIGQGKKEVTIFVDPQCKHCNALLTQLKPLEQDYTFHLVLVPVLGTQSAEISKQLLCNKDRNQALAALMAKDYSKLPALDRKNTTCELQRLQKSVIITKLLDIDGVPFLFLPSHNTFKGTVASFKTLLEKDYEDQIKGL